MCSRYVDKAKNKAPHLNIKTNIFTECIQQLIQWATMKLTVPRLKDTEGFEACSTSCCSLPKQEHFCRWCALQWNICDNTCLFFRPDVEKKKKKAREHFVPQTACKYTAWPDSGTQGDKSVRCIKHFPLFSRRTLPFLPSQTQALQGMPCDGVFLNNCSTFPSFAAHAPPSLLFTARQRIQSPTVNLI